MYAWDDAADEWTVISEKRVRTRKNGRLSFTTRAAHDQLVALEDGEQQQVVDQQRPAEPEPAQHHRAVEAGAEGAFGAGEDGRRLGVVGVEFQEGVKELTGRFGGDGVAGRGRVVSPLRWFGWVVPASLRASQQHFMGGLEAAARVAAITRRMERLVGELEAALEKARA